MAPGEAPNPAAILLTWQRTFLMRHSHVLRGPLLYLGLFLHARIVLEVRPTYKSVALSKNNT